jgi:hypothetical protein
MRGEGIVDRFRRAPILVVLLALLVLAGVTTLAHSSNVAPKSSSIASAQNANSTALYCTGLSGTSGAEVGHLTFFNTTMFPRSLNVDVVSDKGLTSLSSFTLKSHTSTAIFPENLAKGDDFAAAVQVDGSGVIGEEVAAKSSAEAPCISAGVTQWYASGFDTTVGSTANLSIYNPTATPAVFNVSTYSPSGFSAPAPFQGMSVGAHDQMEINLGSQIVNTSNIGVHVNVLRGSIVIEGVQQSGSVVSFNSGQNNLVTTAWYPEEQPSRTHGLGAHGVDRLAIGLVDQAGRLGPVDGLVFQQRARQCLESAAVQRQHFNGARLLFAQRCARPRRR